MSFWLQLVLQMPTFPLYPNQPPMPREIVSPEASGGVATFSQPYFWFKLLNYGATHGHLAQSAAAIVFFIVYPSLPSLPSSSQSHHPLSLSLLSLSLLSHSLSGNSFSFFFLVVNLFENTSIVASIYLLPYLVTQYFQYG